MFSFTQSSFLGTLLPYVKWFIYGLLFVNMTLFFSNQTIEEGLDSLSWLIILLLLEWETTQLDKDNLYQLEKYLVRIARAVAYIVVIYTTCAYGTQEYIKENGSLDLFNASIWLFVIALIEYQILFRNSFEKIFGTFISVLKTSLYGALFIIAILWQMDGEWLDFYDAALWIVCFFFVEINIIQYEETIEEGDTRW